MSELSEHEIRASQRDFVRALKRLGRASEGAGRESARIQCQSGSLHVQVAGLGFSIAARGSWPAPVNVDIAFIRTLQRLPAEPETVVLQVEGSELHLRTPAIQASFPCAWVEDASPMIPFPLSTNTLDALALARTHSLEQIDASGLGALVREALQKREEAIERAFRHLSAFRVSREDLALLVERKLTQEGPG
jgi:hypothetical protein